MRQEAVKALKVDLMHICKNTSYRCASNHPELVMSEGSKTIRLLLLRQEEGDSGVKLPPSVVTRKLFQKKRKQRVEE